MFGSGLPVCALQFNWYVKHCKCIYIFICKNLIIIVVYTVHFNLNLTIHTCGNYMTQRISENTHNITYVCMKNQWHDVHIKCTHVNTRHCSAAMCIIICMKTIWLMLTPLVHFSLHKHTHFHTFYMFHWRAIRIFFSYIS